MRGTQSPERTRGPSSDTLLPSVIMVSLMVLDNNSGYMDGLTRSPLE